MHPALASVRFLATSVGLRKGPAPRETAVHVGGERLRALVFGGDPERATLVATHGHNEQGIGDRRIHSVCGALAAAGHVVLAPELPDTVRLRVGPADVERLATLVASLARPVSLFGVCFSAGICLRAAALQGARDRVRAVLCIGAFGDVAGSIRRVFLDPTTDPYARLLLLDNLWDVEGAPDPEVRGAVREFLTDDGTKRPEPRYAAARAATSAESRALLDDLMAGGPRAKALLPDVMRVGEPLLAAMDVNAVAAAIAARVTLLHGVGDRIFPESESLALARRLPHAEACVTPLLSHGDVKLGPSAAVHLARLHGVLARFFAAARPTAGSARPG